MSHPKRTGPTANAARPVQGTTAKKSRRKDTRGAMASVGYGVAAPVYLTHPSGLWSNVIPVVPGERKKPAVAGHHGQAARQVQAIDVQQWCFQFRDYNVGVVLPDGVIGIDVDAYGEKVGAQTLAELEAELGPLPATAITTNRTDGSGIRLFQTLENVRWPGEVGQHVDLIWSGNRFVVMPPSIHHSGRPYVLLVDGEEAEPNWLPALADLAVLPDAWVTHLQDKVNASMAAVYAGHGGLDEQDHASVGGLTVQLVQLCRKVMEAEPGNRNNLLHWAACRAAEARRHGMPPREAREALTLAAQRAGLDIASINATLDSAFGRTNK